MSIVPNQKAQRMVAGQAQRDIWLASQLGESAGLAFVDGLQLDLDGDLDRQRLRQTLELCVERYQSLRAQLGEDGQAVYIADRIRLPFEYRDLRGSDEIEQRQIQESLLNESRRTLLATLDPEVSAVGWCALLLRLGARQHRLLVLFHQALIDGWSAVEWVEQWGAAYSDRRPERECSSLDDWRSEGAAEGGRNQNEGKAADQAYWLDRLQGFRHRLDLPTDSARPMIKTFSSRHAQRALQQAEPGPLSGLREEPRRAATLAAIFALLHRLTGTDDLVVGVSLAGQERTGLGVVGQCVETLPVRVQGVGKSSFDQLRREVEEQLEAARRHPHFSVDEALATLALPRDPTRLPLFSVVVQFDRPASRVSFGSQIASRCQPMPRKAEVFELFFSLCRSQDTESMTWAESISCQYNQELFEEATVAQWLVHFQTLLTAGMESPNTAVHRLAVLSPDQLQEVLVDWNQTQRAYNEDERIEETFRRRAHQTPQNIAVECGATQLTYEQLDQRSNQLAHHLRGLGSGPGERVGIAIDRSTDLPLAILAVLKTGAAYVGLEPNLPAERIAFVCRDSGLAFAITQKKYRWLWPDSVATVALDRAAEPLESMPVEALTALEAGNQGGAFDRAGRGEAEAYVLYTSGSTGKPKGVSVPHASVQNFLRWIERELSFDPSDVVLAVTMPSFDVSVVELLLPLQIGAKLVVADSTQVSDGRALRELLETRGISYLQSTGATWRLLKEAGWVRTEGLTGAACGEALPQDLLIPLVDGCEQAWNLYGPTETTIYSSVYQYDRTSSSVIIGKPIDNTQAYVLDGDLEPTPIGAAGDLFLAGDGVAHGYHDRPQLNEERFLPDPFRERDSRGRASRLYRTGDRARWRADGNLEYLGREDRQVKVRGYRIELGEIEHALVQHEALSEAVVTARELGPGDTRLVAYVVAHAGELISPSEVRSFLRLDLPRYMIPQHVVELEALPLNTSGKVDFGDLPDPIQARIKTSIEPPQDDLEQLVARVWSAALGDSEISRADNFFTLGGHSLLAVQVLLELERRAGKRLGLKDLILGTLSQVAAQLEGG